MNQIVPKSDFSKKVEASAIPILRETFFAEMRGEKEAGATLKQVEIINFFANPPEWD